jgi:hippurate hydrolase
MIEAVRGDSGPAHDLLEFYQDLHQHPELSLQEHRTARRIIEAIAPLRLDVTAGVGGTGIVAQLRNGPGPTVMLRADMDALPVEEKTGLSYASTARGRDRDGNDVPIAHACGHDMHATCLVGALRELDQLKDRWSGTVMAVFQPAEELLRGARDMIEAGLFERFPRPDIVLGQHVSPLPTGVIGYCPGPMLAATDSADVRLYGRGGHGSRPESTIDPIVLAASIVLRLQGVVAREVPPNETAVVTVGTLHSGTKDNVIPDEAQLGINIRTYSSEIRHRVITAVERIIRGEAAASGVERDPEINWYLSGPVLNCDPDATERTVAAFTERFGAERVLRRPPAAASEDVGHFGAELGVPTVFWFWGGGDPERFARAVAAGRLDQDVPFNHSPKFAPVPEPTLATGVEALVTAALTWLNG